MAYDAQGRLLAATNAANERVFRNFFDPCGNLTNHVDGAARPTFRQFDVLNRCTNVSVSAGTSYSHSRPCDTPAACKQNNRHYDGESLCATAQRTGND
jgi:hypothetical protein